MTDSNLILIPSSEHLTMESVIASLPENSRVIVICSNKTGQEGNIWRASSYQDSKGMKSLELVGQLLEQRGHEIIYNIPDPGSNYKDLVSSLRNEKNIVICTNLSEGERNRDLAIRKEEILISHLIRGNPEELLRYIETSGIKVEDKELLALAASLSNGRYGIVKCYTDSNDKGKHCPWFTIDTTEMTSYVELRWVKYPELTEFDFNFLVTYAKSYLYAKINDLELPYFPRWSPMTQIVNGVVITLDDNSICTSSSMEGDDRSIVDNIRLSLDRICLYKCYIDSLDLRLHILSPLSEWIDYDIKDIYKLNPEMQLGIQLEFSNGESGVYVPQVWSSYLSWSIDNLLTSLSTKIIGYCNRDCWRKEGTKLRVFKVLEIN